MVTNENVETTVCNDRADRMDAGAAIPTNRGEITEADPELIDQGPSSLCQVGPLSRELAPAFHRSVPVELSGTSIASPYCVAASVITTAFQSRMLAPLSFACLFDRALSGQRLAAPHT